jgi:hypothetical protein|nr:hypothetical protein [Bacillus infantis]
MRQPLLLAAVFLFVVPVTITKKNKPGVLVPVSLPGFKNRVKR